MKVGLLLVIIATLFCRLNIFAALICAALALPFWSRGLLEWAGICAASAVAWWIIGMIGASIRLQITTSERNQLPSSPTFCVHRSIVF
jgi:hypothetical protein